MGERIINFIITRTGDGLDVNNKFFAKYSKMYDKTGTVDLEISGDMLNDIVIVSHGRGYIKLGFSTKESNNKASYIQNPRGKKAGTPPRVFLGIAPNDLKRILSGF